ncbi:maleylpyruvate isomerase family mycothiol-dependent enzyme [Actinomadura sp. DC4]|uniref:maleylpyruvate isomerase family mycothiol-dependent enzyme n=1 Tax=Actinomadura sp. DC4 TaxID=3055069 RepID=UPI0025B0E3E4|nr:maleylpyruvate isomerase family mycothiol-dependent enzyme [Actinomadura sp. DC4]MDN3352248.1 maleylpyruvate isomerase family mycothiol-dependent enzyme [Actinomadura sp. DC4]
MGLDDLDPFAILDAEAERLDRHFAGLRDAAWTRASRCAGWTVRDVLAHLAGQEAYNHACLEDDLESLSERMVSEDVATVAEFNAWTVRVRRDRPVAQILEEWRDKNGETRRRMRSLGRDATLPTMCGPYPVGLQVFHFASEYATHADDVGVPDDASPARVHWRARVGRFALTERAAPVEVDQDGDGDYAVRTSGAEAVLTPPEFVAATVGRLPEPHPLDPRLRAALRCLA